MSEEGPYLYCSCRYFVDKYDHILVFYPIWYHDPQFSVGRAVHHPFSCAPTNCLLPSKEMLVHVCALETGLCYLSSDWVALRCRLPILTIRAVDNFLLMSFSYHLKPFGKSWIAYLDKFCTHGSQLLTNSNDFLPGRYEPRNLINDKIARSGSHIEDNSIAILSKPIHLCTLENYKVPYLPLMTGKDNTIRANEPLQIFKAFQFQLPADLLGKQEILGDQ